MSYSNLVSVRESNTHIPHIRDSRQRFRKNKIQRSLLYRVRPRRTSASGDQLGLEPGSKSKIADRSDMGALGRHVMTVGDS